MGAMLVLGIETSCDDTAAAVVEDAKTVRSNVIAAQDVHREFGGVVPELASRAHLDLIGPTVERALVDAAVSFDRLDGIAVTRAPGLMGSLLVGVSYAKALAAALGKPVVGVNHIEAHLLAPLLEGAEFAYPMAGAVVSGGHSELFLVDGIGRYSIVGTTRDDAVGEAFDKAAKLLGLGYPGGPVIDRLARDGDPRAIRFPRATVKRSRFDFSFSGFKTALREHVLRTSPGPDDLPDLAASIQEGLVGMLVDTTIQALEETGVERMVVSGGVAANARLRARLTEEAAAVGVEVLFPPPSLCTDNAAMIARAGRPRLARGESDTLDLGADADLPFGVPWTG